MSSSIPSPPASPQPNTPAPPVNLADPQPWVIRRAKAYIVDLVLCYYDLFHSWEEQKERIRVLEHENASLKRRMEGMVQKIQVIIQESFDPDSPPLSSDIFQLGIISREEEEEEEDHTSRPADEAREFMRRFGDPADFADIEYGPECQRRQALYHAPDALSY